MLHPMQVRNFGYFGDVPKDYNSPKDILNDYQNQLVDHFKDRAAMIADREVYRIQYLLTWKAKYIAALNAIKSKLNQTADDDVSAYFLAIMQTLYLPMTAVNGQPLTTQPPYNFGQWQPANVAQAPGIGQVGVLSPIDDIITKAFNSPGNPDQKPAYQQEALNWWSASFSGQMFEPSTWTNTSGYFANPDNIPPTASDARMYQYAQGINWYNTPEKVDAIYAKRDVVTKLFTDAVGVASLNDLFAEQKDLYSNIAKFTGQIVQTQRLVDKALTDVKSYIDDYNSAAISDPIIYEDFLSAARDKALKKDVPAATPPVEAVAVSAPKKSSTSLVVMAAGAAAIYFVTQGK